MSALVIGDQPLRLDTLTAAARSAAVPAELSAGARERMRASARAAGEIAKRRPVYGRTTSVGANRDVPAGPDGRAHALRLLRSHAGGVGDELPDEVVRATLLVRLAQLAVAGGGSRPEVADAIAEALRGGWLPRLRDLGSLGTGDLSVLAQLGLALAGEWEWKSAGAHAGQPPHLTIEAGDAAPLMSSSASTLAIATLAWADAATLLDAGLAVAALSFRALDGNPEAYAAAVTRARPLPGLAAVTERLRALTAGGPPPARLQDPYGLRSLPAVAGALHESLAALRDVLAVEVNAAAENPLIAGDDALHHGGFHLAQCALTLDTLRLAMVPFGSLALARLAALMEPRLTALSPFLAESDDGSSGLMIAEYVGGDALARLRAEATPAVLGALVISRGLEEHASFAWQGAWQARRGVGRLRTLLALEWVAAERALRLKGVAAKGPLAGARELGAAFDPRLEDRLLGEDVAAAETRLAQLGSWARVAASS